MKGVLSPDEVHALLATVDDMDAAFRKGENVTADSLFDKRNVMEDNDIFVDLMDHPATFPIVRELIGDFIQLSMSEVIVRPPNPKDQGYLHTDGGQAMRTIRVSRSSAPLQVKIHYFLTDLERPDSGNFTVVPGSHNRTFPETGGQRRSLYPGSRAVVCEGRRCCCVSARIVARGCRQPLGTRPENAYLLLQPSLFSSVRLRKGDT